jgi:hypothetical protein
MGQQAREALDTDIIIVYSKPYIEHNWWKEILIRTVSQSMKGLNYS